MTEVITWQKVIFVAYVLASLALLLYTIGAPGAVEGS